MELVLKIDGQERVVRVEKDGDIYTIEVDGKTYSAEWSHLGGEKYALKLGNENHSIYLARNKTTFHVNVSGETHLIEPVKLACKSNAPGLEQTMSREEGCIVAPMPGKVVKVIASVGKTLKKGDNAIILEAMKMETHVPSPQDGKVSKIHFKVGDQVNLGETLIEFE